MEISDVDLTDPEFFAHHDPHPVFKRMRAEDPVHWTRGGYYKASMVAQELVQRQARSPIEKETVSARSSWIAAMRGYFGCTTTPGKSLRCR
jgi:hypothetical protein